MTTITGSHKIPTSIYRQILAMEINRPHDEMVEISGTPMLFLSQIIDKADLSEAQKNIYYDLMWPGRELK